MESKLGHLPHDAGQGRWYSAVMDSMEIYAIIGLVMLGLILVIQAFTAYAITFAIRRMDDLDQYEREMTNMFQENLGSTLWFFFRIMQLVAFFAVLVMLYWGLEALIG